MYLPALSIVSHYFNKRRALAIGVVQSGSSVGGVFFPVMLNNLFVSVGFRWTLRAVGFLMLGLLTIAHILMRPRLPPRGLHPKPSLKKFVTDPPYISAVIGMALVFWSLFWPFFYVQLYATSLALSETFCFYTLTIINAASVVGRTAPNAFADKTGIVTLLLPGTVVSAILLFIMLACRDQGSVIAFCVLYGLASGVFISLMAPMFAIMADHQSEIGARLGFALFPISFTAFTGTPIDGALIGQPPNYTWWRGVVFSGVVSLVGSCFLTFSWIALRKKKGKRWV